VYEADPLLCPKCGGEMTFIAFIEKKDQADLIEKILKHCGFWTGPKRNHPPPIVSGGGEDLILVPEFDPFTDDLPANF
jgi:hypothetical protein